ncbi:hypothetical protein [Algoriphagus winogradskyi]|uniref:Uncharacterized protein n=1 Tax=Algoriphagus winogradskyi TaxID=237017 RepID=A0ABY1N8L1_9BACT|nr:hypothetical protein [Algoriphagus winogradskyi]SMP03311.1 hypothetical protein SAMN06265367_101167 [Algoriphagus winogradskyi]
MIIRNDASHLRFFAYQVGRPKTEVAPNLKFNRSYIAFATLLVEKRIYLLKYFVKAIGPLS